MTGVQTCALPIFGEFYVNITRKVSPPVESTRARALIQHFGGWRVIEPTKTDLLQAIDASIRWRVSFWDGLIVTTARKAEAVILWSEDFNDGQNYQGTTVRNPFRQ